MTDQERFWSKVDKSGECWEWTASKDGSGYGKMLYRGALVRASRLAWMFTFGEIPEDLFVCHHCDNPGCVNPEHLFLGTQKDNMLDMVAKDRQRKIGQLGEHNGRAKLTEADVREIRIRYEEGQSIPVLALDFGVSIGAIHRALIGKHWRTVNAPVARMRTMAEAKAQVSPDVVRKIRAEFGDDVKQVQLANRYGISRSAVSRIIRGEAYSWVK